jgi:hypothetical protein
MDLACLRAATHRQAESGYQRTLPARWSELKLELRGRIPEHRFQDRSACLRATTHRQADVRGRR